MKSFIHSLRYVTIMGLSLSLMACKPITSSLSAEAKVQSEKSSQTTVAAAPSTSDSDITPQKLEQVELGSTLKEVRAVLGKLDQPIEETWVFEKEIDFDVEPDLLFASIIVDVEDGIITSKAWRGTLSSKEATPITLKHFKQVKRGQGLAEIENIIGAKGTLVEAKLSKLEEGQTISAGDRTFSSTDGDLTVETYHFLVEGGDGVIELVNGLVSNISQSVGSTMLPSKSATVNASGSTPDVTLQNLEKIELGSTLETAEAILGQTGSAIDIEVGSVTDDPFEQSSSITVIIEGDIVTSKRWNGPIPTEGTTAITSNQWAKVQTGQTLAEVQKITGAQGVLTFITSDANLAEGSTMSSANSKTQEQYTFRIAGGYGMVMVNPADGLVEEIYELNDDELTASSQLSKAEVKSTPSSIKSLRPSTPTHDITLQALWLIELGSTTLEDAQAILGQPGEPQGSSFQSEPLSQGSAVSGNWLFMDDSSNPSAQVQVRVENGIVIGKTWQDFSRTAKISTTPEQFGQIEIGQNLAEVEKLTGGKGIVMVSTSLYEQTEGADLTLSFGEQDFSTADGDFTVEGYTFSVGDGYGSIELVDGIVVSKDANYSSSF